VLSVTIPCATSSWHWFSEYTLNVFIVLYKKLEVKHCSTFLSHWLYILSMQDVAYCYSAPDRGAEYCGEHVCLCVCVCLSTTISSELHVWSSTNFFVHLRSLLLLSQCSDALRISGFIGDVILVHKLRLLDVATRLRLQDSHAALGLARRNTHHRQQTFGTTSCSQGLLGRSGHVKHSWRHACT